MSDPIRRVATGNRDNVARQDLLMPPHLHGTARNMADKSSELLSIVEQLLSELYASTDVLRFSFDSEQALQATNLYLRVLDLARSCVVLARAGHLAALRIVLRPLLSASADLVNVSKDPSYPASMFCTCRAQSVHLFKRAIDEAPPDSYLKQIVEKYDLVQKKREHESEIAKYKADGGKNLTDRSRFEQAGMLDAYFTDYWFLSLETHNDPHVLQAHHVDQRTEPPRLVYDKPAVHEEMENCVWSIATTLKRAHAAVSQALSSVPNESIERTFSLLDRWENDTSIET